MFVVLWVYVVVVVVVEVVIFEVVVCGDIIMLVVL